MKLTEVGAVLTAARFLWLGDRSLARKSDDEEVGLCQAWHQHLAPYSVDETHAAINALLTANPTFCPSLGVIVSEIKAIRSRTSVPSTPLKPARHEMAVPPALNPYREKLRGDLRKYHSPNGPVDRETLAMINTLVDEVGEHEQKALEYIAAHPDADYGRVTRVFVDAWIAALIGQRAAA